MTTVYSSNLKKIVSDWGAMEEHVLNTSDHLSFYLEMSLNNMKVNTEHVNDTKHVKWRHLSEDQIKDYNIKLEGSMSEYTANNIDQLSEIYDMSCRSIDNMYRDVVQLLVNASNHLPLIRKNNGTKPYWSKSLSIACRNKKLDWRAWVQASRPGDDDSSLDKLQES